MPQDAALAIPIRQGSSVIGLVRLNPSTDSRIRGVFDASPGVVPCRSLFEIAVEAYRRTDKAQAKDYQAEWQSWSDALRAINALELTFGERAVPIEDFEIDDQWRVEFNVALWWQVEQEL